MTKLKIFLACILDAVMLLNLFSPMENVVASDVVDCGTLIIHEVYAGDRV